MTRKKVKLAFIANDASRKATYKKRKKGLIKKVSELSTLCGIEACAIIYSPYDPKPEVWPNISGAQQVISKFKRMPEMEQSKKMVNQESFIRQRIVKATEQLKKQRENNKEKEMKEVMYRCLIGAGLQHLGMGELNHLGKMLDQNLKEINKKIGELTKGEGCSNSKVGMVKGNGVVHVEEQKPSVDFGVGAMQRPPMWYNEWVNNQNEHPNNNNNNLGFGGGLEMMTPFGDNNNATWSSAFFP